MVYKLLARVRPRYSSWYHWRETATFKANRKDWNVDFSGKYTSQDKDVSTNFSEKGWAGCTFTIPAPDRSTWGVISLKNASMKMGRTQDAATTSLSTGDAKLQ